MERVTNILAVLILFAAVSPFALSQESAPQPCPDVTPGTVGCELIAWSHLQDPVPLPEPDAKPVPPSDPQPGQSPSAQAQAEASRRSITGIIVRQGENCVLKAGDNTTYQLDDQNRARQFQDKQVKIVGGLDPETNTLHIESIELVS